MSRERDKNLNQEKLSQSKKIFSIKKSWLKALMKWLDWMRHVKSKQSSMSSWSTRVDSKQRNFHSLEYLSLFIALLTINKEIFIHSSLFLCSSFSSYLKIFFFSKLTFANLILQQFFKNQILFCYHSSSFIHFILLINSHKWQTSILIISQMISTQLLMSRSVDLILRFA